MNKYLIEKLLKHTFEKNEYNCKNMWRNFDINSQYPSNTYKIPAKGYIDENSPIFISLHTQDGDGLEHCHDFFEINYIINGSPIGVIDRNDIYFQKGSICVMNPNAVHCFKKFDSKEDIILNILLPKETFKKTVFMHLLNNPVLNAFFIRFRLENNKPSFIYIHNPEKSTEGIIDLMVKEYLEKRSYNYIILESFLILLFSYILRSYENLNKTKESHINEIIDYIYENYSSCTLKEIAKKFGYHPKYLSHLIHKNTDETFRNLLSKIKLENALKYILYSNYTIDKIIELVGYKEKSSFYVSFKKHYKKTPKEFRNK
jgi:AraC-like DNA-binding protein